MGDTSKVEADVNEAVMGREMEGQGVEGKSGDSVSALPGGGKGRGRGRPPKGKVGAGELSKERGEEASKRS